MQNNLKMIEDSWENRDQLSPKTGAEILTFVEEVLAQLDRGELRVAQKINGKWETHQWIKKAILLSFRLRGCQVMEDGRSGLKAFDKVPLKCFNWTDKDFEKAGFRSVPGSVIRQSAYIAPNVVVMPSFINVGAHIGEGTMIDTWSTIGSCAQIGKNCHISGGVGIGGVLEPLQANPVIIEDNCFIGARSEVAEGVIVGEGAVLSMGVFLGASTKIIDRQTGKVTFGYVPPYSVVIPGTAPGDSSQPALACAVIVKQVDEKTRSKTGINELLRF